MNYHELGHLFFPLWFFGGLLAVAINCRDWRMLGLAGFYWFFAITLFQLKYDGMAPVYGWRWYALVGGVQILVVAASYVTSARASPAIRACSAGIIAVCGAYWLGSWLHYPLPRTGYFVGVNSFQALQVLALIGYSPLWGYAARAFKLAWSSRKKGSEPWERTAHSGQI